MEIDRSEQLGFRSNEGEWGKNKLFLCKEALQTFVTHMTAEQFPTVSTRQGQPSLLEPVGCLRDKSELRTNISQGLQLKTRLSSPKLV